MVALLTSLIIVLVGVPCTTSMAMRSSTVNYQTKLVAQWDTGGIDYLWDATHVKDDYVASKQFQINNNAIAGVKIAPTKAVFVTVPRWFPGVPSTLNTIVLSPSDSDTRDPDTNPTLVPWPSWNANAVGGDCAGLQYVQSMEIDAAGLMWVIDVGRINIFATGSINHCPPKLLIIDTKDGSFVDVPYVFPDDIASHRTNFLNDIVLDNARQIAYISDTSGSGGIVVYDRVHRRSQRFENPATMRADTTGDITWNIGGHSYPSNWTAANTPLDGIALSACGCTLYYTPLASIHLFSISAAHLRDFGQGGSSKSFALANTTIQRLGLKEAPSDGMTFDCAGTLIYGGLTTASVYGWQPSSQGAPIEHSNVLASDPTNMVWVDTFAWSGDELWYTSNQLNLLFTTGQAGPVHLFKTQGSELKGSYQLGQQCKNAPASGDGGFLKTWQVILLCSLGGVVLLVGVGYGVYRNNRRKDDGGKRYAATGSFAEGYISI